VIEDDVDGPDSRPRARLAEGHSPAARALAAYDARVAPPGEAADAAELRAWRAVSARLEAAGTGSAAWWRARWLAPVAAAATVVVVVVVVRLRDADVRREAPPATAASPPATRPAAPPPPVPAAPAVPETRIALGRRPQALATGRNHLEGEATVTLAGEGRADARIDRAGRAGKVAVALHAGAVDLEVTPRAAGGRAFAVVAGPHEFRVLGTVFRVERSGRATVLSVREGRVAVWQGRRRLATVDAGGTWSGGGGGAATPGLAACAGLAERRRWQGALGCYRAIAGRGQSLEAETAHYEAAQLQAERLGDQDGAARALAAHRRQFPRGALRAEVDLTRVELLPRLGRHREALAESAALLGREPRHERAAELHLLRGNILREVFRDYPAAAREYRQAAARAAGQTTRAGVADDAAFFHAVCLEASGRTAEATAAYREYLRRPGGAHLSDARTRAARLSP
jgi:tetratricopeptide (TPR) repeat protein